jgi:hypothetical protein
MEQEHTFGDVLLTRLDLVILLAGGRRPGVNASRSAREAPVVPTRQGQVPATLSCKLNAHRFQETHMLHMPLPAADHAEQRLEEAHHVLRVLRVQAWLRP